MHIGKFMKRGHGSRVFPQGFLTKRCERTLYFKSLFSLVFNAGLLNLALKV